MDDNNIRKKKIIRLSNSKKHDILFKLKQINHNLNLEFDWNGFVKF